MPMQSMCVHLISSGSSAGLAGSRLRSQRRGSAETNRARSPPTSLPASDGDGDELVIDLAARAGTATAGARAAAPSGEVA